MRRWTAGVDEIQEQVLGRLDLNYTFYRSKATTLRAIINLSVHPRTLACCRKKKRKKELLGRHWTENGDSKLIWMVKWTLVAPSDWQLILVAESCLPGCRKRRKEKGTKNQRGSMSQTPPLLLRQRRWPVSPWYDALFYVTPTPPLSSGRTVTTGWREEKHTN